MVGDLYLMLSFTPGTIVSTKTFEMDHAMNAACKRGDARKLDARHKKDRDVVAASVVHNSDGTEVAGRTAFREWLERGIRDADLEGYDPRSDPREVGDTLRGDLHRAGGHAPEQDVQQSEDGQGRGAA